MSKARMSTNPRKIPSLPGTNFSHPSGTSSLANTNSRQALLNAIFYGNRAEKRFALKKIAKRPKNTEITFFWSDV